MEERLRQSEWASVEKATAYLERADSSPQLDWLRAIGFDDVDCRWKWLGMALLGGALRFRTANVW